MKQTSFSPRTAILIGVLAVADRRQRNDEQPADSRALGQRLVKRPMGSLRFAALATGGAALLLVAPLVATAAVPKPATVSIAVTSLKLLDNDTRRVSFKAASKQPLESYLWTFGDPSAKAQNRSKLSAPGHIFAAHKTYTVTLMATTRAGAHASATFKLKL